MGTMMSIGAFARAAGLSISAVRFYAARGLLAPASVDPATGYRSYRPAQVDSAVLIRELRQLEMPLRDIEHVLTISADKRAAAIAAHVGRLEDAVDRAREIAARLFAESPDHTQETPMTDGTITLTTDALRTGLEQVVFAAGNDAARPHLMGVLIAALDGSLRLAATDSHRLAVRDLVPTDASGAFTTVVAATAVRQWLAESESTDGADVLTLQATDSSLLVNGQAEFSAEALPMSFPDYEPLLVPRPELTSVVVDRSELLSTLSGFAGRDEVEIVAAEGAPMTLRADGADVWVQAACSGEDRSVTVNPNFLVEAAMHAVGAEVVIELDDPAAPVVIRSADDGTYTSLLMPILTD